MKNILFLLILTLAILQSCNPNMISGDENTNKPDEQDTTTVLPPSNPEDYFQMEEDPEAKAAILGKWIMIADGVDEEHIQWFEPEPGSYTMEFMENGELVTPQSSKYYMIGKTQLITYIHKRDGGFHVNEYSFINTDSLKLKYIYGMVPAIMGYPFVWIYKRFKN